MYDFILGKILQKKMELIKEGRQTSQDYIDLTIMETHITRLKTLNGGTTSAQETPVKSVGTGTVPPEPKDSNKELELLFPKAKKNFAGKVGS